MEQQEQGWSRTAKVTAAIAGIGLVGAAAYGLMPDEAAEKVADAAGVATDVTTDAVNAAVDNADKALETTEAVEQSASDTTALKDSVADAGSKVAEAGSAVAGAIGEGVDATVKLAEETGEKVVEKTTELAGDAKVAVEETAKGVGEWVKENPYKSVAATTAIAGGTGYIAGRSGAAQSQGHAHA